MTKTEQLTKVPTTYAEVHAGDVIDGERIEKVQSFGSKTRLGFPGPRNVRWTEWQSGSRPVSVFR